MSSNGKTSKTYSELATFLQSSRSNHIFPEKSSSSSDSFNIVMTEGRNRNSHSEASIDVDDYNASPTQIARERGERDIDQFAQLDSDERQHQISQMSAFVEQQRQEVVDAWGNKKLPDIFKERSDNFMEDSSSNYRTSASSSFGGITTKGWDENIQTEIVDARIDGRASALADYEKHDAYDDLQTMHELLAQSSSLARTPTAAVGGGFNAFEDSTAAHPTEKSVNKGSRMGNKVGASPNAHKLRTGVMQAFEDQAVDAGANIAERQMARVLMAKRATTNAFEAPSISGTTNSAFKQSKRESMIDSGREADKNTYSNLRETAHSLGSKDFQGFIAKRTRSSSDARNNSGRKK